ncbi:MAG: DUF362 domain-containing protein [Lachnospiraceae bacterium]|nr:DUF362 domain-containing protein [Lachnospiraceae bacterium]
MREHNVDKNNTANKVVQKQNTYQMLIMLIFVMLVFCVSLFVIRLANAKTNRKIKLNKNNMTITVGKSQKLKVKNLPKSAKVSWKSSKKSVATVNKKGVVKAKKKGKATISCKVSYGRKNKKKMVLKCKIIVEKKKSSKKSVVYMTKDISAKSLLSVYNALNWKASGKTAVKISTGEPPASHYLDSNLIKDLVHSVDGTIVECNTAYGGDRSSTALHKKVAKDHGYTKIAEVDIMDSSGSMTLPVQGGSHLQKNYVGKHFKDYDSYVILSHFKGHSMAGFGGAIKNTSIGIASSKGKSYIHSGGKSTEGFGGEQNAFLESMSEAAKAVSDSLDGGKKIVYINVMNNLSVDCDCDGYAAKPKMKDIGILASTDPVALDQACVDLIYEQKNEDGASLVKRIESRNGILTLKHAEEIGLGSRSYKLVSIDSK